MIGRSAGPWLQRLPRVDMLLLDTRFFSRFGGDVEKTRLENPSELDRMVHGVLSTQNNVPHHRPPVALIPDADGGSCGEPRAIHVNVCDRILPCEGAALVRVNCAQKLCRSF